MLNDFMRGFCACLCCISIFQDWHGKDAYVQMVNEHWIDAKYSVPFAIVVLAIALYKPRNHE